ncbi:hypothetical protein C4D60_Mb09t14300 [Musa balbisiana]|uniref:Uncharacterized protein n=1 Tax=Musa balbisiana TaxID=52838 RepID=A0A4S8IGF2_MUSBA|nr:hypothetical protein C4D60_Mb09t14300 [Musa balbisiana]
MASWLAGRWISWSSVSPVPREIVMFISCQGPDSRAAGEDKAFGRDIVDDHYKARLFAGINIGGIIGEVMPGQVILMSLSAVKAAIFVCLDDVSKQLLRIFGMQWEFQVDQLPGNPHVSLYVSSAGDELWVARYILERITEIAGVVLSFDPKPIQVREIGMVLVLTRTTGNQGGQQEALGKRHKEHIAAYGEGNERRLNGRHETADINTFLRSQWMCYVDLFRLFRRPEANIKHGSLCHHFHDC